MNSSQCQALTIQQLITELYDLHCMNVIFNFAPRVSRTSKSTAFWYWHHTLHVSVSYCGKERDSEAYLIQAQDTCCCYYY